MNSYRDLFIVFLVLFYHSECYLITHSSRKFYLSSNKLSHSNLRNFVDNHVNNCHNCDGVPDASTYLKKCGMSLISAGDYLMDVAAYLGEYGLLEYEPASISNTGCAITNAGKCIVDGVEYIEDRNWESFTLYSLLPAADNFRIASGLDQENYFEEVANSFEKASEIQGCILMACSGASNFDLASKYLLQSSQSFSLLGYSMKNGGTIESLAGDKYLTFCEYIIEAAKSIEQFSILLERGIK